MYLKALKKQIYLIKLIFQLKNKGSLAKNPISFNSFYSYNFFRIYVNSYFLSTARCVWSCEIIVASLGLLLISASSPNESPALRVLTLIICLSLLAEGRSALTILAFSHSLLALFDGEISWDLDRWFSY